MTPRQLELVQISFDQAVPIAGAIATIAATMLDPTVPADVVA